MSEECMNCRYWSFHDWSQHQEGDCRIQMPPVQTQHGDWVWFGGITNAHHWCVMYRAKEES